MRSDSQMPYRNLFFFKDLNMKTLLKKVKIWPGNTKNLWSIHWDHLQLSPISWDYPFNYDYNLDNDDYKPRDGVCCKYYMDGRIDRTDKYLQ